jgi:hypothetical protein
MGYRSDVTVVFYTRQSSDPLPLPALKLWFDENYPIKEATTEWDAKIEVGKDWVMVRYTSVKWYSGYEHIHEVEAALERFTNTFESDSASAPAAYEMLRIGEELNDIEHDHSSWCDWRLNARREIEFD